MGFAIVHSLCLMYPLQLGLQKGCYPTDELKQKRKTYGGTKKEEEKQEKISSSALCLLTWLLTAHLALFICVHS